MVQMFHPVTRVYDHVVQVCRCIWVMMSQYNIHKPLESSWSSMETEWEDLVLPVPMFCPKGCFFLRFWCEGYLPGTFREIQHGYKLGLS